MIDMIGNRFGQLLCSFRIGLAQFCNLSSCFRIKFGFVTHVDDRFGYTFYPDIATISFLAGSLQSRTVGAEGDAVVFPGNIVHTFGILFTTGDCLERFGCSRCDLVGHIFAGLNGNRENDLVVIRYLIGYLRTSIVRNDECLTFHFVNSVRSDFGDFVRAVRGRRIADGYLDHFLLRARKRGGR